MFCFFDVVFCSESEFFCIENEGGGYIVKVLVLWKWEFNQVRLVIEVDIGVNVYGEKVFQLVSYRRLFDVKYVFGDGGFQLCDCFKGDLRLV